MAAMKWNRLGTEAIRSGEWTISRTRHGEVEMYTLWRGSEVIGHHGTSAGAKKAAQQSEGKR